LIVLEDPARREHVLADREVAQRAGEILRAVARAEPERGDSVPGSISVPDAALDRSTIFDTLKPVDMSEDL